MRRSLHRRSLHRLAIRPKLYSLRQELLEVREAVADAHQRHDFLPDERKQLKRELRTVIVDEGGRVCRLELRHLLGKLHLALELCSLVVEDR